MSCSSTCCTVELGELNAMLWVSPLPPLPNLKSHCNELGMRTPTKEWDVFWVMFDHHGGYGFCHSCRLNWCNVVFCVSQAASGSVWNGLYIAESGAGGILAKNAWMLSPYQLLCNLSGDQWDTAKVVVIVTYKVWSLLNLALPAWTQRPVYSLESIGMELRRQRSKEHETLFYPPQSETRWVVVFSCQHSIVASMRALQR